MYITMMLHPSQKVLAVYVTISERTHVPRCPLGVVMNYSESFFAMLFSVIFKKYEYLSSLTNFFTLSFGEQGHIGIAYRKLMLRRSCVFRICRSHPVLL